jgi:hypothetical protein
VGASSISLRKRPVNVQIIPPRSNSELRPKDNDTLYLKAKPSELKNVLENILGCNLRAARSPIDESLEEYPAAIGAE